MKIENDVIMIPIPILTLLRKIWYCDIKGVHNMVMTAPYIDINVPPPPGLKCRRCHLAFSFEEAGDHKTNDWDNVKKALGEERIFLTGDWFEKYRAAEYAKKEKT